MRDPAGHVVLGHKEVTRHLAQPLPANHVLNQALGKSLVDHGLLTPFTVLNDVTIMSRLQPFVTYPWEWVHSQLLQAAKLTLQVADRIAAEGWELKDASAFNIIFQGLQPQFCDHLSFEPIKHKQWWAYGQYLRHFVGPLALSRHCGWPVSQVFRGNLDGVELSAVRKLLGPRLFVHRVGAALLELGSSNHRLTALSEQGPIQGSVHTGLIRFLMWQLDGLAYRERHTTWNHYEEERDHYSEQARMLKLQTVQRWLHALRPQRVLDLGCNQGEFTQVALDEGAQQLICIDADEGSLEALVRRFAGDARVHPALVKLDDIADGQGWMGQEFSGLVQRLRQQAGCTMALALVHHLTIGRSIPMAALVDLFAACTEDFLLVELLGNDDPRVMQMLAARNRDDAERFSIDSQCQALGRQFKLIEAVDLPGTSRRLQLMRKDVRAS